MSPSVLSISANACTGIDAPLYCPKAGHWREDAIVASDISAKVRLFFFDDSDTEVGDHGHS